MGYKHSRAFDYGMCGKAMLAKIKLVQDLFSAYGAHGPSTPLVSRRWTPIHWLIGLSFGSFFAFSNFLQNLSIMDGFEGPLVFAAAVAGFFLVYNLMALVLCSAWRLPAMLSTSGAINLASVAAHAVTISLAGTAQLFAIACLTAAMRDPQDWIASISVYFHEIFISCAPIWAFVYVIGSIALRILPPAKVHGTDSGNLSRLEFRDTSTTKYVDIAAIQRVEAQGNYVSIVTDAGEIMPRMSVSAIEAALPDEHFLRTHRSAIVRKSLIREIRRSPSGAYLAILKNGDAAPVSRRRLAAVRIALSDA